MTPFATFLFFYILIPLFIPIIVLGLMGKRSLIYNVFVGLLMLYLIFGHNSKQLLSLLLYVGWQFALVMGYLKIRKKGNPSSLFYVVIFLSLAPLIVVKVNPLFTNYTLFGFLGISYMTFRSLQILIEIRDGLLKELDIGMYFRFLLFFPTISSGPIDRYRRFRKDELTVPTKEQYKELLYLGINKIFLGFLYKFIIGFLINHEVLQGGLFKYIFKGFGHTAHHHFISNLIYMYGYSFYLFFDFAGYSAFAIGVSYLLGIRVPENFNKPFISRNIKDFWNRWHMTLSFWFRDFVFMRFVFMVTKKKWIKNRYLSANLGYLILFLTMGFWHGFMVHYILYGLYHAVLFICFDWFERKNKTHHFWPDNKWTHAVSIFITFNFVCFGFLIFSGHLIKF
jgi:membrane protein involved in D-alanine export